VEKWRMNGYSYFATVSQPLAVAGRYRVS